jgi:hypothetical protein
MGIPFIVKVNHVSSGGELNFSPGINILLNQEHFGKSNSTSSNTGDLARELILGPVEDFDVVDTAIKQIKAV